MGSSDDNLLNLACDGDRDALGRLLEEHTPPLRARLAGRIPVRWQAVLSAEDVLQQTFTDAFLQIDRLVSRSEHSFAAWLHSIADHNLASALSMLEAEKRGGNRRKIELPRRDDSLAELYDLVAVSQSTPSRHAARDEACRAVERAIEQLPDDYRCVVQMFDLEQQPATEVAAAVGRSPGAMYMIRARAHRWLGELLGNPSRLLTRT
ncbi:MAG TPA: sigma-70 family RNA polymerase sigma factor [Phycisphaerae bacterium]|nr:sigma-70 family RNA polymerase sigma factor [Phycisphaerae bacterium]